MGSLASLYSALSGLRAAQSGVDLVSRNVANATTPGYTRKDLPQENLVIGGDGQGVRALPVERSVNLFLQRELRGERAQTARLDVIAGAMGQVDALFGRPEDETSIASAVTRLTTSLQTLATNPESAASRQDVVQTAERLASQLNRMSDAVQAGRLQAERDIEAGVDAANEALARVAELNGTIALRTAHGDTTADLEDQRDRHLDTLSELFDVKVLRREDNTVGVFTASGVVLLDRDDPSTIAFDAARLIDGTTLYDDDPALRAVGTITVATASGTYDLIETGGLGGGAISGHVELRDSLLVQTQAQLDEIAHGLAFALSEGLTEAATAGGPPPTSAVLDANNIVSAGDRLVFTFDNGGTETVVEITGAVDPAGATAATTTFGTNQTPAARLTEAQADLQAEIDAAAGAGEFTVSVDTVAGTLTVTDALPANAITLSNFQGFSQSGTLPDDQGLQLRLFADRSGTAQVAYTGYQPEDPTDPTLDPPQKRGFAQRIAVAATVVADDTLLVSYPQDPPAATDPAPLGDAARPLELLRRLTEATRNFDADAGIGSATNPYNDTVAGYARAVVSFQAVQVAGIEAQHDDQAVVTEVLERKFQAETGVNVDDEMAELILLQASYAASARVIVAFDEMTDILLAIGS